MTIPDGPLEERRAALVTDGLSPGTPADLTMLYRGELASCNYDCSYCPFAKRRDPSDVLARDRADLERFVSWVLDRPGPRISVLFTPWGEALTRPWYREAMVALSHGPDVERVSAQTNLSTPIDWVATADRSTFALWTTFHPEQVDRARFVARCYDLRRLGIRFSVGIVGYNHHLGQAIALRAELPPEVYLWANAPEEHQGRLDPDHIAAWTAIDPLYGDNTVAHDSRGQRCEAGHTAISVAGDGTVHPCHFVERVIGNLYRPGILDRLRPAQCPRQTCGCHIGYVHLDRLGLRNTYAGGLLERIPATRLWR